MRQEGLIVGEISSSHFMPFEEATDLTHAGRSICLVSLVIPSVVGLQKHLHQVEVHYLLSVVIKLKTALDNRLGDVVGDWH